MERCYLTIDVGGTSIKYALMNSKADLLEKGSQPTPYDGVEKYLNTLADIYYQYQGQVCGIALSIPGIVDNERGYAFTGGSLHYIENFPLADALREKCGIPVAVENDGKCAALAEAWNGSLKDCSSGIVVLLGTGIAGGLIKDGKVYKGKHFSAGEFSFLMIDNCYESTANIWGMQSGNRRLCDMVAAVKKMDPGDMDGFKAFEYANRGDEDVLMVLNQFTMLISKMLFNLQCIYDPEKIAIGGGISREDLVLSYIRKNLDYLYRVFPVRIPQAQIVQCHYFNEANLIGAMRNYQIVVEHRFGK